ncbi:MAG: hypothetical protein IKS41_06075 [Alphaproteobacteria bacterium]|nr:hypothetical protein [Alphaproteobacteria bacterium]
MTEKEVPFIFQKNRQRKTDAEILSDKAAQVLAELSAPYVAQVKQDIQTMYEVLKKAEVAAPPKKLTLIQEEFFIKMHDLKGQGATFGYPLLTDIGTVVCAFLRSKKSFSGLDIDFLKRFVDDADAVIQGNLTGDGGEEGAIIRKHLDENKDV